MAKFTDRYVKSMQPRDRRYEELEGLGFGVRVQPTGTKSFFYVYQFQGKNRRLTLGTYPDVTLAEARGKHAEARKKFEQGLDPAAEDQQAKTEHRAAPTVAELAGEYLEKWAKPRKRSWQEDERILNKDVIPVWGQRKAKDITRRDVVTLLDGIVERGAPIVANRTLALVRRMFNFAMERSIIDASPCAAVRAPAPENQRDRVLTEDEIKALWGNLDKASMSEGTRLVLMLQLLTAQRCGEVVGAAWAEFDISAGWWTITAEQAKNKLAHRVPLSSQALTLLERVKECSGESPWLFPSPRGDDHMDETAIGHAVRRNLEVLGTGPFVPHDLRRTVASGMTGWLGINRLIVSKLLNHVERGITAVYDRASYDREKREALEAWGRRVEEIVTGHTMSNVIPMKAMGAR